jgi:F-type H+-transporting ATPase subunit delta
MSELTVASRYAKSLIDLAGEQAAVEPVKTDMEFLLQTLKRNAELNAVLGNPIISQSKKVAILNDVFATRVNKLTLAFFTIMINKGRGELIYGTATEYINQYNVKNNIVKATVVSAAPLSEANRAELVADVQAAIGRTVILNTKVDPSLIGGFVLTVGDRQIDTSIAGDLKKLKKEFTQKVIQ